MYRLRPSVALVAPILLLIPVLTYGQNAPPKTLPVFTEGFRDHVEQLEGGRIDWANGYILADGVGRAKGINAQQRAMAQRAAELVAARNALALAKGIRIDANGRVADVVNGTIHVQGVLKGYEFAGTQWQPTRRQCRVTIRVPLWGAKGVASAFRSTGQEQAGRNLLGRITLTNDRADVSDFVLVLDARGRKLSPCLFPVVSDREGRVLYDIGTLPATWRAPPVRYVESELSFERLQSMIELNGPQFRLAEYRPAASGPTSSVMASQPASQPGVETLTEVKRRAKRRMAVRVAETGGQQKTQLVLTKEDAERLRKSPDAAAAMRNAQVIVVVDAAAAGTEGRLWWSPMDALAQVQCDEFRPKD